MTHQSAQTTYSIVTNYKTNECYGVRDLDITLYLHIVVVYQLQCVQPDDGHHEGPKHVVVARLTSLAVKV
jgi:hypothetical protein